MSAPRIRPVQAADAPAIAGIYNHYVRGTVVTFEETEVPATEMAARIEEAAVARLPWLVTELDGQVAGYAYASAWKGRCAYRRSLESTIYVDPGRTGQGLGGPLYAALIDALVLRGTHVVIAGIALPNKASVALHERLGFAKVAHFSEVGHKFGRWVDVGYWQRTLESP